MRNEFLSYSKYLLMPMAVFFLSACSEETKSEWDDLRIGEIQVDRNRIGENQPFTLTCAVSASLADQLKAETLDWMIGDSFKLDGNYQDGVASVSLFAEASGDYVYSCRLNPMFAEVAGISASQSISVKVLPCDVRNSFWNELRAETKRNLTFYQQRFNSTVVLDSAEVVAVVEPEVYFSSSRSVSQSTDTGQDRYVYYVYGEHDALQEVSALMNLSGNASSDARFLNSQVAYRLRLLERNEGASGWSYQCKIKADHPSEELLQLAGQINEGNLKDSLGIVGAAIRTGAADLLIAGRTSRSALQILWHGVEQDTDNSKLQMVLRYTPMVNE